MEAYQFEDHIDGLAKRGSFNKVILITVPSKKPKGKPRVIGKEVTAARRVALIGRPGITMEKGDVILINKRPAGNPTGFVLFRNQIPQHIQGHEVCARFRDVDRMEPCG